MASDSKIGWTDHTHNFWWGCHKVSEECLRCYIAPIMRRGGKEPFNGPMRTKNWDNPRRWNRAAAEAGQRLRIFTCSMSDFFHAQADEWRTDAWQVIRETPWLDWLILTKRPERILEQLPDDWNDGYPNVWLGVTAGCQNSLSRVEILSEIPAAIRFVSAEPLLEAMDFTPWLPSLDWIITGCEQAKKGTRRIMQLDWVREIDAQCQGTNTKHFFKQYYKDDKGVPIDDGLLDGTPKQEWPRSREPLAA